MKKKLLLLVFCAVAAGSTLEARRWGHGRHHGRHGGWGRGWGPSFAVTVPIGGGGPKRPAAVKQFKRVHGYYPGSARAFCSWARDYFDPRKAQRECNRYENYLSAPRYSRPAGAISFGVGGGYPGYGYGGYGYGPYGYRRGWW
jgi:hypothetical protein